jgi:hypothetical protein
MLLAALAFYAIVRVAVRHGIEDSTRRQARRAPADADGSRVESPLLDDVREAWHRILGAFGWLG